MVPWACTSWLHAPRKQSGHPLRAAPRAWTEAWALASPLTATPTPAVYYQETGGAGHGVEPEAAVCSAPAGRARPGRAECVQASAAPTGLFHSQLPLFPSLPLLEHSFVEV